MKIWGINKWFLKGNDKVTAYKIKVLMVGQQNGRTIPSESEGKYHLIHMKLLEIASEIH